MNFPKNHFEATKNLAKGIHKNKIARWLLTNGYYPEQYIVPPCFTIKSFDLQSTSFTKIVTRKGLQSFDPPKVEAISLSYPKTQLTERNFGIIDPKIYHDLIWHLHKEWNLILSHLFHSDINIYSYSFPIPLTAANVGHVGDLRAGRMIYEFVEMAEKDLVAESHQYRYLLKTDVKNFYPSVYTHSIAWAIHGKGTVRKKGNRSDYTSFLGLKLDRLLQCANDGCTNGIAIGSAMSDLIGEVVLAAVDRDCSNQLKSVGIKYTAVRFKDDYRFMVSSKEDGMTIIKVLQSTLKQYNLALNEKKSDIKELPEGLFREWPSEYRKSSVKSVSKIKYLRFADTYLSVLKLDKEYPDTGIIDKFLRELVSRKYSLKLDLDEKYSIKVFSLLLSLKDRRAKAFPYILAIIGEIMDRNHSNTKLVQYFSDSLFSLMNEMFKKEEANQYDLIWMVYFVRDRNLFSIPYPAKLKSKMLISLRSNSFSLYTGVPSNWKLYTSIKAPGKNVNLLKYLDVFSKG